MGSESMTNTVIAILFIMVGGTLCGTAATPSKKSRVGMAMIGIVLLILSAFILGAISDLGLFIRESDFLNYDLLQLIQ